MCEFEQEGLKAAGTPMTKALPLATSLARFTLLPGEFSVRTSRSGMESPTWMRRGMEEWKQRRDVVLAMDQVCRGNDFNVFILQECLRMGLLLCFD